MTARRLARVRVEQSLLVSLLKGHEMSTVTSDWPADGRIIDATFEPAWGHLILTMESSMFDEVPELGIIPEWTPRFTRHVTLASELVRMMQTQEAQMEEEASTT